jgi:hypothetical protein
MRQWQSPTYAVPLIGPFFTLSDSLAFGVNIYGIAQLAFDNSAVYWNLGPVINVLFGNPRSFALGPVLGGGVTIYGPFWGVSGCLIYGLEAVIRQWSFSVYASHEVTMESFFIHSGIGYTF